MKRRTNRTTNKTAAGRPPRLRNGEALADLLNQLIDEIVEADEDTTRSDVVQDMADEAGISTGTVNQILRAEIDCPPIERLEGFARALDVDVDRLTAAGEQDGCNYSGDDDDDGGAENRGGRQYRDCGCGQAGRARARRARRSRARDRAGDIRSWYRIRDDAGAGDATVIDIYDTIGYWGVTAQRFVADLRALDTSRIELHLNTPGGDVFDGIAIYDALLEHSASVAVRVDSLAASIGSVVAQAGDTVVMGRNAEMMIHDPWAFAVGPAADHRRIANILDKVGDNIASVYAERSGADSTAEWRNRMHAETWFSAQEAVDAGLAGARAAAAGSRSGDGSPAPADQFDLSVFNFAGRRAAPAPPRLNATRRPRSAPRLPAHPDAYLTAPGPDGDPIDVMRDQEWRDLTKTFDKEN